MRQNTSTIEPENVKGKVLAKWTPGAEEAFKNIKSSLPLNQRIENDWVPLSFFCRKLITAK